MGRCVNFKGMYPEVIDSLIYVNQKRASGLSCLLTRPPPMKSNGTGIEHANYKSTGKAISSALHKPARAIYGKPT